MSSQKQVLEVPEECHCQPELDRHEPAQEDLVDVELHAEDAEGDPGDPREPPLRWEEEGAYHQESGRDEVLVQQSRAMAQREAHHRLLPEGER